MKGPPASSVRFWTLRLLIVSFLAISISLPVALLSLAKVILFVAGLMAACGALFSSKVQDTSISPWTYKVTIAIVALAFLSLTWATQDTSNTLIALVKHTKIFEIVLIGLLIRTPREALIAIAALLAGQAWALASSFLMAADLMVPWVFRPFGETAIEMRYVPYADSYLDQSMMFATSSGIAWHLSHRFGRLRIPLKLLALGFMINIFFLLPGRSGYLMGLATFALGLSLASPPRLRVIALFFSPLILATVLAFSSERIYERGSLLWSEFTSESARGDLSKSTSFRLAAWQASAAALVDRPILGFGVGGWATAIDAQTKGLQEDKRPPLRGNNPHQQFLLWGVELGIVGVFLACGLFVAIYIDAQRFPSDLKWATWSVGLSLLVASFFNSPLYDDLLGDYFCVALGLVLAYGRVCSSELPSMAKHPA